MGSLRGRTDDWVRWPLPSQRGGAGAPRRDVSGGCDTLPSKETRADDGSGHCLPGDPPGQRSANRHGDPRNHRPLPGVPTLHTAVVCSRKRPGVGDNRSQVQGVSSGGRLLLVVADNSNQFVYGDASRCLRPLVQGSEEKLHAMYHAAYLEAAGARPLFFARQMALESARFLGKTARYYPAQVLEFSRSVDFDRLCGQLFPYSAYPEALIQFVCPMPRPRAFIGEAVPRMCFVTRGLYQPYLAPYSTGLFTATWAEASPVELAGSAGLLFFVLAIWYVRSTYRSSSLRRCWSSPITR